MKLHTATDRFTRQLAANGCSAHTRAAYARDLRAYAGWLGNDPAISRISPESLAQFLTSTVSLQTPNGDPRAPITVNRAKSALRSFFAFCVASGWIRENPARLIRNSRVREKEPVALTRDETRRLRAAVTESVTLFSSRDHLIFEVLLGTGIRLGSLVGLNIGDVDLRSGILTIQAKGGGEERVFLNPRLVRMLAAYIKESRTQGLCGPAPAHKTGGTGTPLFRSRSGCRIGARAIQLKFTKWVQDAGIDRAVTVHSLRHTFATRLYEKTGDLYLVQRALGHRNITTTEVYARVSDERLREAVCTS